MKNRAIAFDQIIQKHISLKKNYNQFFSKSAIELRNEVEFYINKNSHKKAFELIVNAKSLKQSTYNLDYLKAICFLEMNQPIDAIESLKEELRFFPNNRNANNLLTNLEEKYFSDKKRKYDNPDFNNLLTKVLPNTMLSIERLFSLFVLTRHICLSDLPGNFVECGVAAGGSSALIASVIKNYSKRPRLLFSFDSFEGMPEPTKNDITFNGINAQKTGWGMGTCSASIEYVKSFWKKIGVIDVIIPVKGYFNETLPQKRNDLDEISFLHLDGDWYDSTMSILTNLYNMIINGGILQVDDYGHWKGCSKAIHEFESVNGLNFIINRIDHTGVWFMKKRL